MNSREIGRVMSSDGTSIVFEREGTGPAIILVDAAGNFHGFSPMPQLAQALAPDFTVFTYDRRGKAASTDTLPYAVDREIEDLRALINLAGGLRPAPTSSNTRSQVVQDSGNCWVPGSGERTAAARETGPGTTIVRRH